ncbi:hypothetical protein M436DRAFT_79080 [Aureobasidium namibiae CBS 147.97]|uniref:Myb-like domain-containing protein n=1 Tax=Aureobasidium namibiae CBS 147.97 TaxID=1043004 RepID=A0A074WRM6_9PEZI|nr:uncharacterized protein M436DRAFT_79080 [Aureobasidium namibiae CBS 147.97]KEQ75803.1 hypothetical protein M436DRAFT_79080 [Aureobasidium namibiae CBS 147.97]
MRITVWVLRPPEAPEGDIEKLALVVNPDDTFQQVWTRFQQRYKENYSRGRRNDCYIKKIQDSTGADIDMRDTVQDILGEFPPTERIVHVQQLLHGRDDTVPFDSYLHPPIVAPTAQEQENINRRRTELDRYGTTLDNLHPDRPVESHERPAEKRLDKDGFAMPALPPRTRVARSDQAIPSSQLLSQDSYEDHLVQSPELGSPQKVFKAVQRLATPSRAANTASQYTTLDAVPSAQKPPTAYARNRKSSAEVPVDSEPALDSADPISEDSQPRLSSSISQTPARSSKSNKRKSLDSSETRDINARNLSKPWTEDEKDMLIDGLAKGLNPAEMKPNFPNRSVDSIRKKAAAMTKDNPLVVQQRKASLAATWTEDEDTYFIRAIRSNQAWKTLHDHRFRNRSDDSVKHRYVENRKRLEEEDKTKLARSNYEKQLRNGNPSTGPNEKFTPEEDDFLLACRIENVEMKRVAQEFFPLRLPEQVTSRAGNLFQNAKRAAAKATPVNLGRSPSVEFLFEHDPETRERIEPQRDKAREFKKKSGNVRAKEVEDMSHRKSMLNSDKERTEERRVKGERQRRVLEASEEAQKQGDQIKRRRLNDDIKRNEDYNQRFSAWKKQAAIDERAGRPVQPCPERPMGSSIGTEILITTHTPHLASSTKRTDVLSPESGSSATSLSSQGTKKRRSSNVEVQVVIPSYKKQKTAAAAEATPRFKQSDSKASSASKVPALATPDQKAPQVMARSAMAKLGRSQVGAGSNPARDRPSVTFASFSATQPVGSNAVKSLTQDNKLRELTSPGVSTAKSLRQSKLAFLRDGQKLSTSSAKKSTPASVGRSSTVSATPRAHIAIDDSIFISSDEESSYDDKDITDEELNAVAERSEAMYSSSPVKSPQRKNVEASMQHHQRSLASPTASDLRSSPPVAPTPRSKIGVLLGTAALQSAMKSGSSFSSAVPSVPITKLSSSTHREPRKKLDTPVEHNDLTATQGDALPQFEMSTAENAVSDQEEEEEEEDNFMMEEDQIQHATHSTPVLPSSSPEAGAQDNIRTAIPDQNADVDTSPTGDDSGQLATERLGPIIPVASNHNTSNNEKENSPQMNSDTDDVKKIDCYRSDSSDVQPEGDWPSVPSDREAALLKPPTKPFHPPISTTERAPNADAAAPPRSQSQIIPDKASTASKENGIAEQAMSILTSSPSKAVKVPSTASHLQETSPLSPFKSKGLFEGPSTYPAAHSSKTSPEHASGSKKARRSQGRRKGSRILDDAESFMPPQLNPLPDLLKGGGLRKQIKKPVENGHETITKEPVATNLSEHDSIADPPSIARTTANSKRSVGRSKGKRPSLSVEESVKTMLEKGQALGNHPQAPPVSQKRKIDQPASTQPVKKVAPNFVVKNFASSQPANDPNDGRVINPHAFDWDNAQDSAELIRQADQRMRDAANMAPEDFWKQSNLNNVNEEQILSHMIAQGVKRSMERRKRERGNVAVVEEVDDFAAIMPATQPIQRSVSAIGHTPRPATQPVMRVSHQDSDDESSSSEDDDSEEETTEQSLENLAKKAEADREERRGVNALPYW